VLNRLTLMLSLLPFVTKVFRCVAVFPDCPKPHRCQNEKLFNETAKKPSMPDEVHPHV
jgi:hypothetical protein